VELRELIRPLRRWWWLIVAATVVAAVSSYFATRGQPPIYRTQATVMIGNAIENANPNSYDLYLTEQLANTYADIAKRDTLQEAVKAALGISWLPGYTARVVPNTQLIEFAVVDTDPQRAQVVANELVNQLIRLSPTGSAQQDQARTTFVNEQLNQLEIKIRETQDQITQKQDDLANMFSARQIADTQNQIAALQNKLATLQANYAALLSNTPKGAINAVNVVESATLPLKPIGPNKLATILLAIAIGFSLATAAAYLMDYLDDTLKNPDDVQRSLGLTTLGAVPRMEGPAEELAMLASSQSAATEAYRVLRTNLQFAAVGRPLRTLLVTSPAPSEGKSLTVANLAVALAQAGRRVIVVDTDLHRPRLHRLFGLRNNTGVTTALLQEQPSLDGLMQETAVSGLRVLTSGPLPPNPAELLGSSRMRDLVAELGEEADVLLFDSPPAVALSDAAILATQIDGVLLVLDASATRREVARRALEALQRVNAHIVGALLNRMPTHGAGYYYYYYYYHYGYNYGSDNGRDGGSGTSGSRRRRLGRRQEEQPTAPAPETPQSMEGTS
jgi:succinoglycan biosynthesis transport protein ExoP